MDQQKTKILIIAIILLVIGLIGAWIFVVRNMLSSPEQGNNLQADIQQKQGTGVQETGDLTTDHGQLGLRPSKPTTVNQQADSGQATPDNGQLSSRAFRILLPPGHDVTTRKRLVKQIYSQTKILAIPYLSKNRDDYLSQLQTKEYSIIIATIPQAPPSHRIAFQRSEELTSFYHATTLSRSGAFTSFLPFAIDPYVLLVRKDLGSVRDTIDLEQALGNTNEFETNLIFDRFSLIKKKQQKLRYEENPRRSDLMLSQAIYENNTSLLRLFLRLPQYSSQNYHDVIQELLTTEIRCQALSHIQCLALIKKPKVLGGLLSDILSSNQEINTYLSKEYQLQPIPTMDYSYPIQARGIALYDHQSEKAPLAQSRVLGFLKTSIDGSYDLWPNTLSVYQKIFHQQKFDETFGTLKQSLNIPLTLLTGDQASVIDTALLEVIEGNYNSDIRIKQQQKAVSQ